MLNLQRLDADTAASVCQLVLWAPSSWLKAENTKYPSSTEVSNPYFHVIVIKNLLIFLMLYVLVEV